MNNPENYQIHNRLPHRDNMDSLEKYGRDLYLRKDYSSFIDIGCGDGSFTMKLKDILPDNFEELVAIDMSEEMISFAKQKYVSDCVSFKVLNIINNMPEDLLGRFDLAFSFFALHWVKQQDIAFSNIFHVLKAGGSCFTVFLGSVPLFFDVYRILKGKDKWSYWCDKGENYISPYHDCPDPESKIGAIMTKVGFTNVRVIYEDKTYFYGNLDNFKKAVRSVNPFRIPTEYFDEYLNDFVEIAKENNLLDESYIMKYKLIIAYGTKQ